MTDRERHDRITCHRCGNCCHVDVAAHVSPGDIRRWESEGRHDIIEHVRDHGVTWVSGRIVNRFGSTIRTCLMSCVYLKWQGPFASCEIYETRTKVCRSFIPGSSGLCPQHGRQQNRSFHTP